MKKRAEIGGVNVIAVLPCFITRHISPQMSTNCIGSVRLSRVGLRLATNYELSTSRTVVRTSSAICVREPNDIPTTSLRGLSGL